MHRIDKHYKFMQALCLSVYFACWLWQGHFLFQLEHAPLKITGIDNVYWLFCILRIPQTLMLSPAAWDILLIAFFVVSARTSSKLFYRLFFLLALLHTITFNIYSGVHTKACVFLPLSLLPFCFPEQSGLLRDGLRYYLFFIFTSAALYKVANGGLLHPNQLNYILQAQHDDLSILDPGHLSYRLSLVLREYPFAASLAWFGFILLEFSFIAGFFSRRFDLYLFMVLLSIQISTLLLMRIQLMEFILFYPLLLSDWLKKYKLTPDLAENSIFRKISN